MLQCYYNKACLLRLAVLVLSIKNLVNILHPLCSGWVSEQLYYRHFTRPSLCVRVWLARLVNVIESFELHFQMEKQLFHLLSCQFTKSSNYCSW